MSNPRTFFIAIGLFYALGNFLGTLPFGTATFLGPMYPGVELYRGEPIFQILQDAWIIVGIQLGAIGLVALWGARDPWKYIAVIPVVIVTEVVDGIWDIYSGWWSYETKWLAVVTVIIHLVWIAWAIHTWRLLHRDNLRH